MTDLPYIIALHSVDGLGAIRLRRILDYFQDPKLAWSKSTDQELKNLGVPENVIALLHHARKNLDPERYYQSILDSQIKILTINDPNYPDPLKQIYNPPAVLYYRGEILEKDENAIGIVGTRKVSGYGRTITQRFAFELAQNGFTIVSGLAKGVDTIAHNAAIQAQGRTLAILGGGLNQIFPLENIGLAKKISDGFGAVISEYPPDASSLPGNFPQRNRIIAALSKGVVVTEAAEDSGSMITARLALEYGKEVFAVPGPITSELSRGPSNLIKDGAKLTFSTDDILAEFGKLVKNSPAQVDLRNLTDIEKLILENLDESKHIDQICRDLQKPAPEITAALIKMEIKSVVLTLGGGVYSKNF